VARGTARFNAGRLREALADFRAAFRLGVDRADARYFSAHAHLSLGEIPQATAAYASLIRAHPSYLPAYLDLAVLLHQQGRILDAAKTLRAALKREPGHSEARRRLAELKTGGAASARPGSSPSSTARRARPTLPPSTSCAAVSGSKNSSSREI
jgi:tetratricopeptide (TPR) repeat protein